MQPDLILVPFAQDAPTVNVDAIPVNLSPSDPPQAASWSQGFPTVTMTPLAAGGIPPRGQSFNGVLQDITQHLVYIGGGGQYKWSSAYVAAKGGYSIGDVIQADSGLLSYVSLVDNNTDNFNTNPSSIGPKWRAWAGGQVPNATTDQRGAVLLATQSQVNAGSGDAVVTPEGRAVAAQVQSSVAFTTSGTATAQALTPLPAISAYAPNQRFNVTFNVASGANPTINISGRGAKNLKQYDPSGNKVAAVFAANQNSDIVYDGVDVILLDQLPVTNTSGVVGAFSNLKQSSSGINASISISADEISLESTAGIYLTVRSVSLTASLSASGVNGLDTGVSAASTWYSIWVISNGVGVAALLSLSSTSPAMPAGYTFKARTGWVRSDGTANKYPLAFTQAGRAVTYSPSATGNVPVWPSMSNGAQGTISASAYTPIAVATSSYVPPTASRINGRANSSTTVLVLVGVSGEAATYTGVQGTNPPQFSNAGYNTGTIGSIPFDILLKTTSIYWASSDASSYLRCFGWEDNL